jgi:hypothetical protein
VDDQIGASRCPKCGSGDHVRTARELFDRMNMAREEAYRRSHPFQQSGPMPGQSQSSGSGGTDDGEYDHYNVEGSDPRLRDSRPRRGGSDVDVEFDGDSVADDIGAALAVTALGFAGRALAKRMKRVYDAKLAPAMEEKAAQWQRQWERSKAEQDQIVARYPELRGCMRDEVVFLDGGDKTLPVKELKVPVTLAQADDVVARLRLARLRYLRAAIAQRMAPTMARPAGGTITDSATGSRGSRSSRRAQGGSSAIAVPASSEYGPRASSGSGGFQTRNRAASRASGVARSSDRYPASASASSPRVCGGSGTPRASPILAVSAT